MRKYMGRQILILGLVLSILAGECLPSESKAASVSDGAVTEQPEIPVSTPEPIITPEPTLSPAPSSKPTVRPIPPAAPTPTVKPTPTPGKKYELTSPKAKYSKGGQTGIHYHKVKGKKIYHIVSYTTDTVKLTMSHASVFSVYGGGSKSEVKKKLVTVSSKGVVKCHRRGKGEKLYTIIQAKSKVTGEVQYIYIYFKKKLSCNNGSRITMYEKHTQQLSFDYAKSSLSFSVEDKKNAVVNKKGRVKAGKKGTTYVTVKVKDSENNQVRIKVVVKEEPWLVSKKDKLYDYEDMSRDLNELKKKYGSKTGVFSIGKSWDDRDIWCLRIGSPNASKRLVIDAAIHAREWKNTQILMRQAEEILRDYSEHRERFSKTCIYIIPMDNPDGVAIAQYGFDAIRSKKLRKLCKKLGHAKVWKANARGVNLNDNFPAGFSKKKKSKKPHYMKYPGKKAGSEKETKALMKFINQIKPDAVLNLHSTGSVIYWDFNVDDPLHQKLFNLAEKVNSFNKYRMMPKSGSTNAAGGFADWLVYEKGITSITVETGTVLCPLPHSQFKSIYKKNNKMFRWFMTKY